VAHFDVTITGCHMKFGSVRVQKNALLAIFNGLCEPFVFFMPKFILHHVRKLTAGIGGILNGKCLVMLLKAWHFNGGVKLIDGLNTPTGLVKLFSVVELKSRAKSSLALELFKNSDVS